MLREGCVVYFSGIAGSKAIVLIALQILHCHAQNCNYCSFSQLNESNTCQIQLGNYIWEKGVRQKDQDWLIINFLREIGYCQTNYLYNIFDIETY